MDERLKSELRSIIAANNFEKLHILLNQMSWQHRCALHLRFWEDHTIAQIAGLMNMTWQEADKLIEEAIEQLRTTLTTLTTHAAASIAA